MDKRTFAYQIEKMNPDLSINVFTTTSLEQLFKAKMLRLDSPQTFCSEQVVPASVENIRHWLKVPKKKNASILLSFICFLKSLLILTDVS